MSAMKLSVCSWVVAYGLAFLPLSTLAEQAEWTASGLYHDFCSVCHGDQGNGDSRAQQGMVPPPKDFSDPIIAATLTRERMVSAVADGKAGTAMSGWSSRLSNEQIEAVVDFVRDEFMPVAGPTGVKAGSVLYDENCSVCHGDDGSGSVWASENLSPAPRRFIDAWIDRERMINSINNGVTDTAMPGFGGQLSVAEVYVVVDYIRGELMPAEPASSGGESLAYMSQTMPNNLIGDKDQGRALYLANRTACHGASGDGDGPRAYFIFPKPRNFTAASARGALNRPGLFAGIKDGIRGKEMPAWGKVMSDQQIADVAEFVFEEFIRNED
jgi:mono/diheme cytochrome c family protein